MPSTFKALATLKPQAGIALTPTTPTPAASMPVSIIDSFEKNMLYTFSFQLSERSVPANLIQFFKLFKKKIPSFFSRPKKKWTYLLHRLEKFNDEVFIYCNNHV
jgi:hypothetical protein